MTEEVLNSINKRLALLIKSILTEELEGKSRTEQVQMLEDMDFRDEDITEVLGITRNNLNSIRSRMED